MKSKFSPLGIGLIALCGLLIYTVGHSSISSVVLTIVGLQFIVFSGVYAKFAIAQSPFFQLFGARNGDSKLVRIMFIAAGLAFVLGGTQSLFLGATYV